MPVVVLRVIPERFLLGTDTVNGLDQAFGKEVGKGPDNLINLFVQKLKARIGLVFLDKGACLFSLGPCLEFSVDDFFIPDIFTSDDLGIADPLSIHLQDRDSFTDQVFGLHLVGGPHLAGDAVPHGIILSPLVLN